MASGPEKCPVDHGSFSAAAAAADKCPVDHKSAGSSWTSIFSSSSSSSAPISSSTSSSSAAGASIEKCPVDHKSVGSSWTSLFSSSTPSVPTSTSPSPPPPPPLTQDREVSSIPKLDGTNWVYPSQAQFFSAMARKNHHPQASDMRVIVPIHNAVNERAWAEILGWEEGQGGEGCGGVRLVSFKGRPRERTPRARWKMLLGYVFIFLFFCFCFRAFILLVGHYSLHLSISFDPHFPFFLVSCGICAVLMLRFLSLDVRTNAYIHLYIYNLQVLSTIRQTRLGRRPLWHAHAIHHRLLYRSSGRARGQFIVLPRRPTCAR